MEEIIFNTLKANATPYTQFKDTSVLWSYDFFFIAAQIAKALKDAGAKID